MLHGRGSTRGRHERRLRVLLAGVALCATAGLAIVAATAVPALANGSHGKSGAPHGKSGAAHGKKGSHGKSGSHGRGNSANAHLHVTICHATPPDTAANGYVRISPSASGVYHGHLRQHDADIIPPFSYNGYTYSENWDATGQAIWNNGCVVPSGSTTGTGTTTGSTTGSGVGGAAKSLSLGIEKLERVGATGSYVRGPLSAKVGDTIFYEIRVRNLSGDSLDVTLSDGRCDAGTLTPSDATTLAPGATAVWYCSHMLTSADAPAFVNVATARGYSASANTTVTTRSRVKATVSGVAAAHKTVRVRHHARPARAVTGAASFTG